MPLDRRRRAWRRSFGQTLLLALVVGVVLFFVIGGIVFVGDESAPYRQAVNRSFADQASLLVDQSNQSGRQLAQLLTTLPTLRRSRLQDDLDSLVAGTAAEATSAAQLLPPAPPAGVGPSFSQVLADRATAVFLLRNAVDGLLGLQPQPVSGASSNSSVPTVPGQGSALLPSARALSDLQTIGSTLQQADQRYAGVRRTLAAAAGHGILPRSVWISRPRTWSGGELGSLVARLASSSSLATRHGLQLVTVSVQPPAVPPPTGPVPPGGVTTVPPTNTLEVSVVLRNAGNVAEPDVVLTASAQVLQGTATSTSAQHLSIGLGATVASDLPPLAVHPGRVYTLRVAATSSSTAAGQSGAATSYTIAIGPGTPPTTTTTTTRPVSRTTTTAATVTTTTPPG